ncbi:MAG: cadmium-translocating P-type ATPase [Actinomycetota bacterium]|nr:cadmium-translocating P-type ATPase [Actinomycetota bacterium]
MATTVTQAATTPLPPGDKRGQRVTRALRDLAGLSDVRWSAVAVAAFVLAVGTSASGLPAWLSGALFAGCYVSGGWKPGLAGLRALRQGTLDVDLLMVVAAVVAAAIGQTFDGALLIVIFATSGALEAVATKRTADSVRSLLSLALEQATRLGDDGREETVDTATLTVGAVLIIRPGERIGADGVVVEGCSDIDQATITGESLPVDRQTGDEVFAGTLNGSGTLQVRVSRPAEESVVARIVAMVDEASATKAATQLFIEKIEQRYSVGMVTVTVLLLIVPLLLGAALSPTLLRAMTFMIVASPCGVVLATMPPLLSAIANAGRHGVLVKSAVVMERLGMTTLVAFDKTGTLTEGRPRVTQVTSVPTAGYRPDEVLALAAAAEHPSEHPLGRAVVAAAHGDGLMLAPAEEFRALPGRGVQAIVEGRRVTVRRPLPDDGVRVRDLVGEMEGRSQTAVVVDIDEQAVGVLGLADRVRPGAAATVRALALMTGASPVLLTGDNVAAATAVGHQVAIADIRAGLLPQDKVTAIKAIEGDGGRVLLVGDGINDAPAMAAAHLGLAMGRAGSDLALQTSDAVIVRDDLATVPALISLSRQARTLVIENLVIAAAVIVALVTWDLAGHLPLPLGVAGHEGSTVIIGLNGLRLLRRGAWPKTRELRR